MDETSFLRARRDRPTLFVSGLVDALSGRLLDGVEDRTASGGRVVVGPPRPPLVGPHRDRDAGSAPRLRQRRRRVSGHATLVVDHFHIVSLANRMIDDVRRRVQQATLGHRGRKHDPLYHIRKLLLKACDDLDTRGGRGWPKGYARRP
jgi:transposase